MLKILLAVTSLTLSMAVNAASVTYTMSDGGAVSAGGTFTWENGIISEVDITICTHNSCSGLVGLGVVTTTADSINVEYSKTQGRRNYDVYQFTQPLDGLNTTSGQLTVYSRNAVYGTHGFTASPSAVPLPAAAWLFGSAILGLAAVKRKKA